MTLKGRHSISSGPILHFVFQLVGGVCIMLRFTSISAAQQATPQVNAVLNAASYSAGNSSTGQISPGAIIAIFGTGLTDGRTMSAVSVPLPRNLAGATVLIHGVPSPLFYASATQISAQVPIEVAGTNLVNIQVRVESATGTFASVPRSAYVGMVTPGIFTLNQNGRGPGVILRSSDFSLLCPAGRMDCTFNLATPAEVLAVYATGLGLVNGSLVSGEATNEALSTLHFPSVTIGGVPARVLYSGSAPGFVGLYQINVIVPNHVPIDEEAELVVSFQIPGPNQVFTVRSNTVTLPANYVIPTGGGPSGGTVNDIAVDPNETSIIYVATEGGVFRSTDGGGTWTQRTLGMTTPYVKTLVIDFASPAVLYAGTLTGGVFKSTDGSESWVAANNGLTSLSIRDMVIDPSNPATIYAMTSAGVFKTTTGGEAWTRLAGSPAGTRLAIDPANHSILYAKGKGW
jgi:uncharacterized protein (TIGR03437 family)